MAIRIASTDDGDATTVRVEGRLDADAVEDLLETCRAAGSRLQLDLECMLSVDEEGILVLGDLASQGVPLLHASPYIRCLMNLNVETDPRGGVG